KSRTTNVKKGQTGLEPPPRRTKGAGCAHLKRLIEIRGPEREIVLETSNGTREAPIVGEERADRSRALDITGLPVGERCRQVGEATLLSHLSDHAIRIVPRLIRDRDDVA